MPRSLLPEICAIARQAGQVILRYYNDPVDVMTKADGSPVTRADHAAEAVIVPALHHLTPEVPVVSEEAYAAGQVPDVSGGRFWLVDPLDGTREFISHNGEFTVNIALIEDGVPVLGVVYAPFVGDLYAGAGPGSAMMWVDGRGDHGHAISARRPPSEGVVVMVSRRHGDRAIEDDFLKRYPVSERLQRGSSLKFCEVARGAADFYPRFGTTCEWDTAAGNAVLLAAGGRVDTLDGSPLRYGKPDFRNPHYVASGAP
ncbi:MAG: 3'(2'),5'-bisphosphate nucleotidase CysQ [Azospirillum sp.]|nr:3'(2'),5'-bisphosphate nucleotidase CysQ [Azospirillum sp.]